MINGRTLDWESIRIDAPWGLDLEIQSISYSSERPVTAVYGRGNNPKGYGQENLTQEATIEMDHRSWLSLTIFAATQGGISKISPFVINVGYSNADQITQNDVLPGCKIVSTETEANQGDAEIKIHSVPLMVLDPILYNGVAFN